MCLYINTLSQKDNLTEKILADIIESFIAALFIDKGIKHAEVFCQVCLFPKLAVR